MTRYTKVLAVVGAMVASAALADGLPNLPGELKLPMGKDSAGEVTFRHESHVDAAKPRCLGCHPERFGLVKASGAARPAITHARMEKGESCGACHGKEAFGFDDCTSCHAQ